MSITDSYLLEQSKHLDFCIFLFSFSFCVVFFPDFCWVDWILFVPFLLLGSYTFHFYYFLLIFLIINKRILIFFSQNVKLVRICTPKEDTLPFLHFPSLESTPNSQDSITLTVGFSFQLIITPTHTFIHPHPHTQTHTHSFSRQYLFWFSNSVSFILSSTYMSYPFLCFFIHLCWHQSWLLSSVVLHQWQIFWFLMCPKYFYVILTLEWWFGVLVFLVFCFFFLELSQCSSSLQKYYPIVFWNLLTWWEIW